MDPLTISKWQITKSGAMKRPEPYRGEARFPRVNCTTGSGWKSEIERIEHIKMVIGVYKERRLSVLSVIWSVLLEQRVAEGRTLHYKRECPLPIKSIGGKPKVWQDPVFLNFIL